jgi:hypothetical protein
MNVRNGTGSARALAAVVAVSAAALIGALAVVALPAAASAAAGPGRYTIVNADSGLCSRCSTYSGALGWPFASDGHLAVTFGGRSVTL